MENRNIKDELEKLVTEGIEYQDFSFIQEAFNIAGDNEIFMAIDYNNDQMAIALEDDIFYSEIF